MSVRAGQPRPPATIITPRRGWLHLGLPELWRYRELGYFLSWRDFKVRYKQTVVGAAWAVLQPVVLMAVFTVVLGRSGGKLAPPAGIPAPIFYFSALLAWSYFAQALQASSASVVTAQHIVTKVYFPRLILPVNGVLQGLPDFVMSSVVMSGLMVAYGFPFRLRLVVIPALLLLAAVTALGAGLWLSASSALYRDIRLGTPFLIQVLMFASVIYPTQATGENPHWLLGLNPMAVVIEGCRWALLGNEWQRPFPTELLWPAIAVATVLTITGLVYFRRIEDTIVDVV